MDIRKIIIGYTAAILVTFSIFINQTLAQEGITARSPPYAPSRAAKTWPSSSRTR
jgi:hypothetical protein